MVLAVLILALAPESSELVCEERNGLELCRRSPNYDGGLLVAEVAGPGCDGGSIDWQNQTFALHPVSSGRYHALAPIVLNTDVGAHRLEARCGERRATFVVHVERAPYPESQLRVARRFSKPPPARTAEESRSIHRALASNDRLRAWTKPYLLPRRDRFTSVFGVRRLFNKALQSQHRGLDIDGRTGRPIYATNDGFVALVAENYFYVGNAVFIDHGENVFSMYFHLSETAVKTGERVKRGQRIGRIGKTGRVTGPHLHFGIKMSGFYVDPLDVLDYRPQPLREQSVAATSHGQFASPDLPDENRSD
ncbi:MAG: M23 family metallopeptidase [Myxococcota bacterium]